MQHKINIKPENTFYLIKNSDAQRAKQKRIVDTDHLKLNIFFKLEFPANPFISSFLSAVQPITHTYWAPVLIEINVLKCIYQIQNTVIRFWINHLIQIDFLSVHFLFIKQIKFNAVSTDLQFQYIMFVDRFRRKCYEYQIIAFSYINVCILSTCLYAYQEI